MTISPSDPFATPDHLRSPVRRLRGRLPAAVTLWTAPGPAGLAVSSTVVVDGEPGRLLGVLDEESDLWAAIEASGRFAVTALTPADRQLADRFAGLLPAPGGLFAASGPGAPPGGAAASGTGPGAEASGAGPGAGASGTGPGAGASGTGPGDGWADHGYGPVRALRTTWAGCRLDAARPFGWGLLVEATIERVELGEAEPPLVHHRGRYRELA